MGQIVKGTEDVLTWLDISSPTSRDAAIAEMAIISAEGVVRYFLGYDPKQRTRTEYYPQREANVAGRFDSLDVEGNQAILYSKSRDRNVLAVRHLPIRSITSIKVAYGGRFGTGDFDSVDAKVEGTDYWATYDGVDDNGNKICRDGRIYSQGLWPIEPGSIQIVYSAGYTTEEFAGDGGLVDATPIYTSVIQEAVRRAKYAYAQGKTQVGHIPGAITSERMGDYSYSADAGSLERQFSGVNAILPETRERLSPFANYSLVF